LLLHVGFFLRHVDCSEPVVFGQEDAVWKVQPVCAWDPTMGDSLVELLFSDLFCAQMKGNFIVALKKYTMTF
jgi:hypothetical protein